MHPADIRPATVHNPTKARLDPVVLVVDDSDSRRDLVELRLRKLGASTLTSPNVAGPIAALERSPVAS